MRRTLRDRSVGAGRLYLACLALLPLTLACSSEPATPAVAAEDGGPRGTVAHDEDGGVRDVDREPTRTTPSPDAAVTTNEDAGAVMLEVDAGGSLPDNDAGSLPPHSDAGSSVTVQPAMLPSGQLSVDQLPASGAVGFILAAKQFFYYRLPDASSTSINHISPDGTKAFGWYSSAELGEQGFELDLDTNEYAPIVIEGTRFTVVRGGHGSRLVGKLADDSGTPEDPDDDVRMGFIHDTESGETLRFTREGFEDIGFTSLNADGVATGFNDFGTQGFLFVDGDFVDLDDPNAYRLFPFQINDRGQFVGFWGSSEDTWYDNSINPSFVGVFDGEGVASLQTYEFPGYAGTGLAGINNAGVMAGIAYPTVDSLPLVFSTAALDALPTVHRLPEHLEPFVVGIDSRGWIYGQIFIHERISADLDPEASSIAANVAAMRTFLGEINGPAHSGPLSSTIHSPYHDVETPIIELEVAAERLLEDATDRQANAAALQATLVDDLWIDARWLGSEVSVMQGLVEASEVAETDDARTVIDAIAGIKVELSVLRERLADMAEQFQEPPLVEYTGLGGPLNPKLLANGNLLVALATDNRVVELSEDGTVVWSHSVGQPTEAQRLESGNTLIASAEESRVFELAANDEVVWEYPGDAIYGVRRLANGNTLVTIQGEPAQIIEVDGTGEIVWQYGAGTPPLLAPSAHRLANGHTLIADNSDYSLGAASVIELDTAGDTVWSFDRGIFGIYGLDRLPTGSTLINDQSNGRLLEVSSSGERLWSYGALELPGGFQVLPDGGLLIAVFGENRVFRIAR